MRRSLSLRVVALILWLGVGGAGALQPVRAQFGTVQPAERLQAGQRVNAFVPWQGTLSSEGLTVDLPPGWQLQAARAVHEGTNAAVPLRLTESRQTERRIHAIAPSTLRGPHRFVLSLIVGAEPGDAALALTPLGRRQDNGRLAMRTNRQVRWDVGVDEAARPRGRAFARDNAPLVLDRRALPSLDGRAAFTVEAWLRTTGLEEVVLSTWDGREGQPYPLEWLIDAQGRLVVYRGEPGRHIGMRTPKPVADGRWHHIALAHDPENERTRLFLDGTPADSLRTDGTAASDNRLSLVLGERRTDGGQAAEPFSGLLDEVRLWDRARSRDELRYTMRQPLDETVEGLVRLGFEAPLAEALLREPVQGRAYAPSDLSFSYPVEALGAEVEGASVRLVWETKDRENERFTVERSTDGRTYRRIGTVRLRDRIAEAADGTMRFAYTDLPPESALLYYRVRQQFADAPDRLSGALKLGLGADGAPVAVLEGNSPNPFFGLTTITFELGQPSAVRLSVWDISGSRVALLTDGTLRAGRHAIPFDAGSLPSGVYFVRLQTPEARLTHKMTLTR